MTDIRESHVEALKPEFIRTLQSLQPQIDDEFRAYDDDYRDSEPSMLVSFAVDVDDSGASWDFQTGDTQFMGPIYMGRYSASVALNRDASAEEIAELVDFAISEICEQLYA